jgi:putative intracellular protease/amidase
MPKARQVDRPDNVTEPASRSGGWGRFALRLLELVVAMSIGMFVLGGALHTVMSAVGVAYPAGSFAAFAILEMGVIMAVPAAAWMRYRGHGWASTLELSGAVLVPTAAVILLVSLGVFDGKAGLLVQHVVLVVLVLVVMVRHRAEFSAPWRTMSGRPRTGALRRAGRVLAYVAAFAVLPVGVGFAGAQAYQASRYGQPEATAATAPVPTHDPDKPTAVIVVGNAGANVADVLVPYDVLATTEAFNVYTVASERRPIPLLGGLDLVPDLSFAQLEERLKGASPDVTIVPEMPVSDEADAPVTAWLRDYASDGLLVSVCTGARLLAEAGLLDGRPATTHWYRLPKLQREYPDVEWKRGSRYIDDGDVITTGGLLSSIDGSLRVVERLVDNDAAAKAAQAVGWRYYSPSRPAPLPVAKLAPENAVMHLLNLGFRANGTTVGVVLADGVGELELAAAFDPYPEARAARTLAIAAGDSIRSRHGLTFVPRARLDADVAQRVDRLLVPGAVERDPAVDALGVPVDYLHEQPGFAFDPALREMASSMDQPTARWAAKLLEYPATGLGLSGVAWPWMLTLSPIFLGLTGMALLAGFLALARRARRTSAPR